MHVDRRIRNPFLAVALSLAALLTSGAAGASVMNGDFSSALDDWLVIGGPTVSDGGGFALLANDGVSGFRGLEQTFGLPASGGTLSFDFHFSTAADQQNGDDAFFVGLDVGGTLYALMVIDDSFGLVVDPDFPLFSATPLDVSVATGVSTPIAGAPALGGTTESGTLSFVLPASTWGMDGTLFFELVDGFFNTFDTRAAVDNVTLTAATVSAPTPLALALVGLLAALGHARTRRTRG